MLLSILLITAFSAAAAASNCKPLFTNLVTFGDSYTDDGRLSYYASHNGSAPPPGVYPAVTNVTASGGPAWGQYVQQYSGARYVDYAISGATCSNEIISRLFSGIGKPFPSVMDDEIVSFDQDINSTGPSPTGTAADTVYALWIGTNDLGWGGFLSDSQAPNTSITSFVDCVWSVFDNIYRTGGRRFVLLNQAPLNLAPLYATPANGGTLDGGYWANKTLYNATEYNQKIMEYTTSVNTIFGYGVPFNLVVAKRWPESTFIIFDVHSLMTDIYNNPKQFLDAPYNATGYYHHCPLVGACTDMSSIGPLTSFLWYDELHPSTKTDTIIAKNFLDVVAGNSTYGVTYRG